jgi:DNA polymerase-3 subunit epsilon
MLLNKPCAIVDIETTGGNHKHCHITEFAVLQWQTDGSLISHEQLVNPQQNIPPFISKLTGIDNSMVAAQPSFSEVALGLKNILDDHVFIAHNVRFDYGFIKRQLADVDIQFRPIMLCTVRLARALYPQWPSYSLDNICQQIGYNRSVSHRAMADVLATKAFIDYAISDLGINIVNATAKRQIKRPSLPAAITEEDINNIANTFGVYYFYDDAGKLLYVGKSNQMQDRVLSHFGNDVNTARGMQMVRQIAQIETTITGGELAALLLENQQIKALSPIFNRRQRRVSKFWCIALVTNDQGYKTLTIVTTGATDIGEDPAYFGFYSSKKSAKQALQKIVQLQQLCAKVNGDENGSEGKACFARQLKRCRGACQGEEAPQRYNLRVDLAVHDQLIQQWPFEGPIAIIEENRGGECVAINYVDNWAWLTTDFIDASDQRLAQTIEFDGILKDQQALTSYERIFDKDMYHVIRRSINSECKVVAIE